MAVHMRSGAKSVAARTRLAAPIRLRASGSVARRTMAAASAVGSPTGTRQEAFSVLFRRHGALISAFLARLAGERSQELLPKMIGRLRDRSYAIRDVEAFPLWALGVVNVIEPASRRAASQRNGGGWVAFIDLLRWCASTFVRWRILDRKDGEMGGVDPCAPQAGG